MGVNGPFIEMRNDGSETETLLRQSNGKVNTTLSPAHTYTKKSKFYSSWAENRTGVFELDLKSRGAFEIWTGKRSELRTTSKSTEVHKDLQ